MAIWIVIILGIVQGACEFLPVSSSGHLVLFYNIFNITDNTILLSVILHVATLLSVIVCYWKDIIKLIKNPFCNTNKKLVIATIPTVIIVLLLKSVVKKSFGGDFIIIGFLITAIVLFISQMLETKASKTVKNAYFLSENNVYNSITDININTKQALFVGVAQGLAIFPGISRSGSTIAMGLMCGVKKSEVADFSFLLSIPIIIASLLFEIIDVSVNKIAIGFNPLTLFTGFIFSFLSGLICIKLMLKFVKKSKLYWFSFYLVLLSIFLILNSYVLFLF